LFYKVNWLAGVANMDKMIEPKFWDKLIQLMFI